MRDKLLNKKAWSRDCSPQAKQKYEKLFYVHLVYNNSNFFYFIYFFVWLCHEKNIVKVVAIQFIAKVLTSVSFR